MVEVRELNSMKSCTLMSCPYLPTVALPHLTGVEFKIPCGNRIVKLADISSNDVVFPSNTIGIEPNGDVVLAENCMNKKKSTKQHCLL